MLRISSAATEIKLKKRMHSISYSKSKLAFIQVYKQIDSAFLVELNMQDLKYWWR